MCSAWIKQGSAPELSLKQIEKVFSDTLFGKNIKIINLTGGEPTLREDMVDVVRVLAAQCPNLRRIDIPTNGINTQQVLDKIERTLAVLLPTPVKLSVTVSVDGVGDVHERIRGVKDIFPGIRKTIEGLKELSCIYPFLSVSLNTTITKFNVQDLENLRAFSRTAGVGINFTLAALSEIGVESIAKQGSFEIEVESGRLITTFIQEITEQKEMEKSYGEFILHWLKTGERAAPCNFRKGRVILMEPDGNVYACGNFKEFLVGNVLKETFGVMWKRRRSVPGNAGDKCRTCNSNCYMGEI